jgi:UDP:flavonoid glycosyltransferase YjiC (YdhE family)
MRITIVAVGSRGDVQAHIALGCGLQAAGYPVRLATHAEFEPLVRLYGLDFHCGEGDPRAVLGSGTGQDWLKSGGNPLRFFTHLRRIAEPIVHPLTMDSWHACQDADLVLYSQLAFIPVYAFREKLRAPAIAAYLQPSTPTQAFPTPRFPPAPHWLRSGRGSYNRWTYRISGQLFWQILRGPINDTRRDVLGLPPLPHHSPYTVVHRRHHPHLYGYSRYVVPRPRDWGSWNHVTGYWFLDRPRTWQPPAALLAFLESGPPPVYIGFGSMKREDPAQTTTLVVQALTQAGQRGVLLTGWGGLGRTELPETMFAVDDVPHDWLFPRMAAVVHHGGAGTTAAGLRAGLPSVLVPFFGDQPFWARRVAALGVGPTPIPSAQLSVSHLSGAITEAVSNNAMRARAAALGQRIRAEDGVGQAVAILQRYLWASEPGKRRQRR